MNPVLQQRYAQMQQMMRNQPNADMEAYNGVNKAASGFFNKIATTEKDNRYGDIELTDYRNEENKNWSDKQLYDSIFRQPNSEGIRNGIEGAMGGSMVEQFKTMNPEMNKQTAGSIGPLSQVNFGYDINNIGSNYGWKPNANNIGNKFNFNLGGVGYGG